MIEYFMSEIDPNYDPMKCLDPNWYIADLILQFALMIIGATLFACWVVWMCKTKKNPVVETL